MGRRGEKAGGDDDRWGHHEYDVRGLIGRLEYGSFQPRLFFLLLSLADL